MSSRSVTRSLETFTSLLPLIFYGDVDDDGNGDDDDGGGDDDDNDDDDYDYSW